MSSGNPIRSFCKWFAKTTGMGAKSVTMATDDIELEDGGTASPQLIIDLFEGNELKKVIQLLESTSSVDKVRELLEPFSISKVKSIIEYACKVHDLKAVMTLMLKALNKEGHIPKHQLQELMSALDLATVKALVTHGCDFNAINHQRRNLMFYASFLGLSDLVHFLIGHGASVNISDAKYGSTPLCVACQNRHIDTLRILLDAGAKTNIVLSHGATPVLIASQFGFDDVLQMLIDAGARVNYSSDTNEGRILQKRVKPGGDIEYLDFKGITPLLMPSQQGHFRVVELLVNAGANVNQENEAGMTALIRACHNGHLDIANLLIQEAADVDHQNFHGLTAFIAASVFCQVNILKELISRKRVNHVADLGHTSLHAAIFLSESEVYHYFRELRNTIESKEQTIAEKFAKQRLIQTLNEPQSVTSAREATVRLMLEYVDDVNARTNLGETAFYLACSQGMEDIAAILEAAGANINLCDFSGMSPLATAAVHEQLPTVAWLSERKDIDLNLQDAAGSTALYRSCENGKEEVLRVLIRNGASLNVANSNNVSPLNIASSRGHVGVFQILLVNDANKEVEDTEGCTALLRACEMGNWDVLELLFRSRCNLYARDVSGNSAMHFACRGLHSQCLAILLKHMQNVDILNRRSETPLSLIGSYGGVFNSSVQPLLKVVVELLLNAGANINHEDYRGGSLLFTTCLRNDVVMCDFLISKQAKLDATDRLGRTVLHNICNVLAKHVPSDTIAWCLERGININAQDINGQTCLHISAQLGNADSCSLLLRRGANPFIGDKNGITPVCLATEHPECFAVMAESVDMATSYPLHIQPFAHWFRTLDEIGSKLFNQSPVSLYTPSKLQLLSPPSEISEQEFAGWKMKLYGEESCSTFVANLLKKYGTICDTDISITPMRHLQALINSVADLVDPRASFTPILAGSLREGTKVLQPDEGDYVMDQNNITADMFEEPVPHERMKSCVTLRFRSENHYTMDDENASDNGTWCNPLTTQDGYLSRRGLFSNTYCYTSKTLLSPQLWQEFDMFYRLSLKDVSPDDQHIRHLDLIYHDEHYPWLPITVDLVPAINFPTWYPPWCRQDPFHLYLLKKHGVRVIAKWVPVAHENPKLFKLSFCRCEFELFHAMPRELKQAYKLAKILKDAVCPCVEQWMEEPGQFISSYFMKTLVFWIFREEGGNIIEEKKEEQKSIDVNKVVEYARVLFTKLEQAFQKQYIENFWLPGENLLQDSKYAQYGWCAANYARLLRWILEPNSAVPGFASDKQT